MYRSSLFRPLALLMTLSGTAGAASGINAICDSLNTPEVLAIGAPNAGGQLTVTTLSKAGRQPSQARYTMGQHDVGAGLIFDALRPLGGAGNPKDGLDSLDPKLTDNPTLATYTPSLTRVTLGGQTRLCRWLPGIRLLGVTARRTVLVVQGAGGALSYQSFDFKAFRPGDHHTVAGERTAQTSTPSLLIKSGQKVGTGYVFSNGGYVYRLSTQALSITRGSQPVQQEPLLAWLVGGP